MIYNRNFTIDAQKNPAMAGRLLESSFEIARTINNKQLNPNQQLHRILAIILDYLAVDHGSIMFLEKKKTLVVRAASRQELVGFKQNIEDNSVAAWVARHREPLFIPDISKDDRFAKRSATYKKNSLLSVPLMNDDTLVGVINVTDRTGKKDLLQDDISYLLDFSGLVISLVEQQRLYREIKKKKETLRLRNQELRREEQMRAELTKMLIHDLKGPLSEVMANLDILSYTVQGENKEFLESAQIGCERAVRMASNLVDTGKMEDGKLRLLKQEVVPKNLLEESLSAVKGLAKIKNIELALECPDSNLPSIKMDRVLILRVLQNLVTNALGHCPSDTMITLGCGLAPSGKGVEIFVQDQGAGISPEHQLTVFEKYGRLTSKIDALVGTGLGLYFCRLAVEAHQGRIAVHSAPGQGSRFVFTLPL